MSVEEDSHTEASAPSPQFSLLDVIVVVAYFVLNLAVGIWATYVLLALAWVFVPVYVSSGTDLYSGALFVQVCLGWNLYLSTVLMLVVTAVYTIAAFHKIGGYPNLEEAYLKAVPSKTIPNTTCHLPRPDAMHLFRDPVSGDLPWTGMTLGLSVLATWYWCTDQVKGNTATIPDPHWANAQNPFPMGFQSVWGLS
ncbi:hypothetical protein JD844_020077 [Phrynosoma platyrhinos]|uniref:Uncharacterized protein n=1 Tax=Phrynosoma platyrhinos TaxID=52577 RepID=A0ABQ7TRY4_PHRPL|nr:hypothetical protein JD844_020077 [Phrynosoma platyrhinos]